MTTKEAAVIRVTDDLIFTPRFDSCRCRGREMYFREKQAGIIEALVRNYEDTGFTAMSNRDLLSYVYPPNKVLDKRVQDVFKVKVDGRTVKHEGWGLVVGPGKAKGTTRLLL